MIVSLPKPLVLELRRFRCTYLVDRDNAPIDQPFTRRTLNVNKNDKSPVYRGPNLPLLTTFGEDLPVGTSESGVLIMSIEMLGVNGHDVTYDDVIEYIIIPCT